MFIFFLQETDIYVKSETACKKFIESIFWMLRSGAQWRELPPYYGK